MSEKNSMNGDVEQGDSIIQNSGKILAQTLDQLANQYVTEVKVDPQTMIIIFY